MRNLLLTDGVVPILNKDNNKFKTGDCFVLCIDMSAVEWDYPKL